jgi:hypothetical protein
MSYSDIDYDKTSQVGRISKEMAKDYVEEVISVQIQDLEACAYYDGWDEYFGFELTEEEGDFIFAVDRRASAKVRVTW